MMGKKILKKIYIKNKIINLIVNEETFSNFFNYSLSSCGGYKPIFKSKETNFYISKINNLSQDKISNQIKMSLNPYLKDNGKMSIILNWTQKMKKCYQKTRGSSSIRN